MTNEILQAKLPKSKLTRNTLIGMLIGIILGSILHQFTGTDIIDHYLVGGLFTILGSIFIASLKMLVVPLVFVSLVCGVTSLADPAKLGRIGGKTIILYLFTTSIAISIALTLAVFIQPGLGFNLESAAQFKASQAPGLIDVIINIFPSNPIKAMSEGNMLQIIVFAILLGVAATLSGEAGARLISMFQDMNKVILKLVTLLMNVAPYGVFALIAKVFTEQGFGAIDQLAWYFAAVVVALLIHATLTFSLLLKVIGRLNPLVFFKKIQSMLLFAFSTASSNATLPITLDTTENRLGAHNSIASFTVPLGATLNMDGTAIMQGVATVFIAQAYNIDIGLSGYLIVIGTATLASIGTAGVPGVGLIMLAMVLRQVGLPVEGIALIIGVDRLLDMLRTAVNVTGDAAVTSVVANSEQELDLEIYNDPQR